ncbi:winged helix DNA-binding domain-containing protein [Kibdelosporangium lantanae]
MSVLSEKRVRLLRATAQAIAGGVREPTAEAVVRRVFAIQAQDAAAAELGIRVRGRDVSAEDVRAAYEDDRSIVRNWYLRGTLQTIPSEDAHWILRLLAPQVLATSARRFKQLGLTDRLRERADTVIRRALTHGPLTRAELTERLTALDLPPDRQVPFHLIRHAALNGILCHGPADTYVLVDDWLPAAGKSPSDAVAELAHRYLAAYAPAAVEDFATWSGLPLTAARAAWKALPDPLDPLLDHAGPDVRLLPAYDNYLLGYRTRENSVPAPYQARVWPGGGIIRPTVIADGLVVGTWTRRAGVVHVDAFEPLPARIQRKISYP